MLLPTYSTLLIELVRKIGHHFLTKPSREDQKSWMRKYNFPLFHKFVKFSWPLILFQIFREFSQLRNVMIFYPAMFFNPLLSIFNCKETFGHITKEKQFAEQWTKEKQFAGTLRAQKQLSLKIVLDTCPNLVISSVELDRIIQYYQVNYRPDIGGFCSGKRIWLILPVLRIRLMLGKVNKPGLFYDFCVIHVRICQVTENRMQKQLLILTVGGIIMYTKILE